MNPLRLTMLVGKHAAEIIRSFWCAEISESLVHSGTPTYALNLPA